MTDHFRPALPGAAIGVDQPGRIEFERPRGVGLHIVTGLDIHDRSLVTEQQAANLLTGHACGVTQDLPQQDG